MAGTFQKTVLHVDDYESPDGKVAVTPERLQHWARQHQRMTANGYTVPMHFDHSNKKKELLPITVEDFKNKSRSAKNTVGRMHDFRVSQDGQSAEITFQTSDDKARKLVAANDVYVSPVIFPAWKDGHGNEYDDILTHLDLVNHAVDFSQGPAVEIDDVPVVMCALRMGLSKPLRLASKDAMNFQDDNDLVDDEELDDEELDDEFDDDEDDDEGGEGELDDEFSDDIDGDGSVDATDADAVDNTDMDNIADTGGDGEVGDIMLALADHGIVLPADTSDANFKDRLKTALIATSGDSGSNEFGDTFDQTGDTMVTTPQIATMSTGTPVEQFANTQYKSSLMKRLDNLLESGRCNPAEHKEHAAEMGAVRLSLSTSGKPKASNLSRWIKDRGRLPEGAVWNAKEKLRRMSVSVAPTPAPAADSGAIARSGEPSAEDIDAAVKELTQA